MPDQLYTRCPACKTVFRVTPAQLAIRSGQVRCGQCQTVFDGQAELVPRTAPSAPPPTHEDSEAQPTVGPASVAGPAVEPGPALAPAVPPGPIEYEQRFSWDRTERRRRGWAVTFAVGMPLLLVLLALQALLHFRDAVAARWPAAKPMLAELCDVAGCTIRAPRDIEALAIEGSELQADPAHRGLLILTATLRNRSALSVSYPYIELALTDARDQTVASRALAPRDYVPGTVDLGAGLAANAELGLKLFIDASATNQAGYRLYLFYP